MQLLMCTTIYCVNLLGRADVVTLLLARGADVNVQCHRSMTAYIFACGAPPPTHVPDARRPRPEARCIPCPPCPISCAVLVCCRAVHHCACMLCVPLCYCVRYMRRRGRAEHGFAPVAEALLAAGANPALANREGYTAAQVYKCVLYIHVVYSRCQRPMSPMLLLQRARGPYGPPRHAVLAVVKDLDPGVGSPDRPASPGSGNSPATAAAPARVRRRPS